MRNHTWISAVTLAMALAVARPAAGRLAEPTGRKILPFDSGWKFFKGDPENANENDHDDSQWPNLDVPHDWTIEGPFAKNNPAGAAGGYLPLGVGWYRKHFKLDPDDRRKMVFIQFDGIYKNSDVWINGKHLGKRWYGYASFQYDLTKHVNWDGNNILAVRVDNSHQTCRWYSGSGIYRHVWLTLTERIHVAHWGTYVTTPEISQNAAKVNVKTTIKNDYAVDKKCAIHTTILDERGIRVAFAKAEKEIQADGKVEFSQDIEVVAPALWSVQTPGLYSVYTTVYEDAKVVDRYVTPFGIRKIDWNPEKGLLVNEKPVLLKGVCIHHDLGALGAAFNERAMARRLDVLKNLGCNAIRTSHNPPAPQLLEMCDVMGFLVIDEAFDKWRPPHHATWEKDWKIDLTSMIHRDRNHPSVILWSVGNEVRGQETKETREKLETLVDYVHKIDPTRKVTCGTFPKYVPDFVAPQDIAGLNYQEQWFDEYRKQDPNILIISTEAFPYYRGRADTIKAFYEMNPWFDTLDNDHVVGTFYWTGIDYLGEAVPGWPCHGWNCSLIDTCGFPRPISQLQRSLWTEKPMVFLAVMDESLDVQKETKDHWYWPKMVSHWTLPKLEGKDVKVVAFTNCDTVELFLNGLSVGTRKRSDFPNGIITWTDVPCLPGVLKATGKKNGETLCWDQLITAGKPAEIELRPDYPAIWADGKDLCHVEVRVVDEDGILVPDAQNLIQFDVSSQGKIVAVDNGNLWSTEQYKAISRKAYHGRALVIIKATDIPGNISLTAKATTLEPAQATIEVARP